MGHSSSKPHWDGSEIPSQAGKIVIITGANSGIGYVTARTLAERGARVVLACRSESRGRTAEEEMTAYLEELKAKRTGALIGSVEFMQVDMSNLASVRAFAEQVRRNPAFPRVDLLINNAGVVFPPNPFTADGIETQFGVNHVGHFLLTALLFDLLKASPAARVVSLGSLAHQGVPSLEFDSLVKGTDHPWKRYGKSKLANLLFTYELGRRLEASKTTNVISVAAHPGLSYTSIEDKMIEATFPKFLHSFMGWVVKLVPLQPPEMGALPTLYAATVEDVANGEYCGPHRGRRGYPVKEQSDPPSHNREEATRLWTLSEELTGETFAI
jgi:NAD(P)-dependent dehydrogenase (short-subunit alcohol dehydrogenase family)